MWCSSILHFIMLNYCLHAHEARYYSRDLQKIPMPIVISPTWSGQFGWGHEEPAPGGITLLRKLWFLRNGQKMFEYPDWPWSSSTCGRNSNKRRGEGETGEHILFFFFLVFLHQISAQTTWIAHFLETSILEKKPLWHANSIPSFSMSLLTCVFVTKHIVWRPGRLCGDSSRWKILQVFLCYTLNIRSACTIDKTNLSQINASSTFNISIMFSTLASFVWGLTGALLIMSFSCVLFFCNGLMV